LTHVGNDVVDLSATDAPGETGDIKFIKRVLCRDEQEIAFNSDCPGRFLWAFWAAKETAYKAIRKTHPDVSSAPRRYPVIITAGKDSNHIVGEVNTPKGPVAVNISIHVDYIHCIGAADRKNGLDRIVWDVQKTDPGGKFETASPSDRESILVRMLAKGQMAECLNCHPDDIQIIRHQFSWGLGPPIVYIKGKEGKIDLSLSHDGRFAAYAFLMDHSI
jgi:phosphopantetheine--protein transferase-like protein